LLFWIQQATIPGWTEIVRATLSGERPERVVSLFGKADALALDFASERLVSSEQIF